MIDTVLVIAWLVLAHLVADFVLQNDWIAINKGGGGRAGWAALATHGFHVGLCLVPVVFAFGVPGIVYIALVVVTHMLVDRWKVRATRRAERNAQEAARTRLAASGDAPDSGLGSAWSPWPGMLFVADQVLHLTIAIVAWLVVLEGVPLQQGFVDVVNTILRDWDRATVNAVVLTTVVLVSLFLVNTRAAYYFVLALVSPRWVPADPAVRAPETATAPSAMPASAPSGYTVRVGPLVATVEPGVAAATPHAIARVGRDPIDRANRHLAGRVRPAGRGGGGLRGTLGPPQVLRPHRGSGPHRGDHRRPGAAADRRVRAGRRGGGASASSSRPRPSPGSSSSTTAASRSTTCWARSPACPSPWPARSSPRPPWGRCSRPQTRLRGIRSLHARLKNGSPSRRTSRVTVTSNASSSDAISPRAEMSASAPNPAQR